jgi:hypothetical protein
VSAIDQVDEVGQPGIVHPSRGENKNFESLRHSQGPSGPADGAGSTCDAVKGPSIW